MKKLVVFVMFLVVWLLLSWPQGNQVFWQAAVSGVVIALLTTFIFGDLPVENAGKFFNPKRYILFMVYVPYFLWLCLKANLDVACRVIHPDLPINPGIVKVKTSLKSDIARVFLANSITLTPGTLTVDMQDDILYIHWIAVESSDIEEASKAIVAQFEWLLKGVFE